MKHNYIILALCAVAVLAAGCKKDEETSTSKSFSGIVKIGVSIPKYVANGDVFHITPSGVSKDAEDQESDPRIGYYYTASIRGSIDTTRSYANSSDSRTGEFDFVVPAADTLGTLTMTVSAFAKGYYSTSSTTQMEIVRAGVNTGSITNFKVYTDDTSFTDPRDSKTYLTMSVGDTEWMRQNLAYAASGIPFEKCKAMTDIFGMYYTWDEVSSACPSGWRVPTAADWDALETAAGKKSGALMDDIQFNGSKMWTFYREVQITNSTRFSAIPAGYAMVGDGSALFKGLNDYANFWCNDSGKGTCRYINVKSADIYSMNPSLTDFAAPVRCVRNK